MKYRYLLIANIGAFAIAGHYRLDWLGLGVFVADFWIWRTWLRAR